MSISVPNLVPQLDLDYRIAIIGESPGRDDVHAGQPFVGTSGRLLTSAMQNAGLIRSACFIGNICQVEKRFGDEERESKQYNLTNDPDVQLGLNTLKHELNAYSPNIVFLLGKAALQAAGIMHGVNSYRGSLFTCMDTSSPFFKRKCIASFNPAAVIRNFDWMPLLQFDTIRAKAEAGSPELLLPQRYFDVELTADQICEKLSALQPGVLLSIDIEGGVPNPTATKAEYRFPGGVSCISFATDPSYAFIVNIQDFGISEQTRIMHKVASVLGDPSIPKVLQNSLYDNFCLSWIYKFPIRNVVWDTMLSGWEIYPELPKSLGVQASLWTREPFYKHERGIDDKLTHYRYCCKDAAVTLEIAQAHKKYLASRPEASAHLDFNTSLLPAFHYMELRGIRYNKELAASKLAQITASMATTKSMFDDLAGLPINPNCNNGANSLANILYKKLGYEPQYAIEGGRRTDRYTADVDALLKLLKKDSRPIVGLILKWRALEGQRKQLEIDTDLDGRMRCGYNIVGTDTGRLNCNGSPTGSGTNLQTITKKLRCLYQADPGKIMFQCDLSGADGWTVAAHCKARGDSTMFDDYIYGLKPARIIAAMYETQKVGTSIGRMSRDELRAYIKSIDIPEWLYFSCKRVQHGSNYRLGATTMSSVIMKDSWKVDGNPVYVTTKDCKDLQTLYMDHRYTGVHKWQQWVEQEVNRTGKLSSCSGHTRTFFGRRNDHATINAALSQEPQANTTYVTNLALYNLWNDPENRRADDSLIIEPLHQVHDALIGQFDESCLDWALGKIRSYFDNPISIANIPLTIPFEGNYGPSWGELDSPI